MSLDLEKVAIRRLLDTATTDLYNRLSPELFSGRNKTLYKKIEKFYTSNLRIPTFAEFLSLPHTEEALEYLENEIRSEEIEAADVNSYFIADMLQDHYIRGNTIKFLNGFVDELEDLSHVEIMESINTHVLNLNKAIPETTELFDIGKIDTLPTQDSFVMYPSGLHPDYDNKNGGLALQELVMLGGRRGSGKSIIATNLAFKQFLMGGTAVFMSIEMRYLEVYYRLMSMMSGISFLDMMLGKLTQTQKYALAQAKLSHVYNSTGGKREQLLEDLKRDMNFEIFDKRVAQGELLFKDNRFIIIDNPELTISRIDHYLNMLTKKHKIKLVVVDYLNIIKIEDRMNWQSQILLADSLKGLARKYNITIISPYQIDAAGEARFAKGVLDSADRSFRFMPADLNENADPNILTFDTAKIRNGVSMKFDVRMNWDCVRIENEGVNLDAVMNPKTFGKYGGEESNRDIG